MRLMWPTAAVLALAACSPEAAIREAAPSVVWVPAGAGHGSGVIVAQNFGPDGRWRARILTAKHVVEMAPDEFDIVAMHPVFDVAIVDAFSDGMDPPIDVRWEPVRLCEELWKIGYGNGQLWISSGEASAQDRVSADIHHGDSGGAIVDKDGNLVGIVVALYIQDTPYSGRTPANSQCLFIPMADLQEWFGLYVR